MFTLIKREIEDNLVYFLAAALLSAVYVFVAISLAKDNLGHEPQTFSIGLLFVILPITTGLVFMAMGASQMTNDKNRKVSAFLSTLPVTRTQILLARVITGVLAILVLLLPVFITAALLMKTFVSPYVFPHHYLMEIFSTIFLMAFASYCMGLQIGLSSKRAGIVLAIFIFSPLIISLIFIKGFAVNIIILLLLLVIASLERTWQKFVSTAL